jgi:iron complex outermembrane receptor protein
MFHGIIEMGYLFYRLFEVPYSLLLNVFQTEEGGLALNEAVVTGTRTAPRSNTTAALPIDGAG